MKRALVIIYLLAASFSAQATSWSDLWLTRDQQGQRLLDSGKPAQAASTFTDSRRRAYAEIKAGQYTQAAQRLEHFADAQSQYNRGNALARSGKLENALAAYDQAIQQTTADSALGRDARNNRKLVAEQLKQQSSQSQSGGKSQSAKNEASQSGQSQSQQSQSGQSQSGQSGDGQQDKQQGNQRNAANGSKQQQSPGNQGSQGEQSQQRQASTQQPQSSQRQSGASEAEQAKQAATDAKRDAEAAMAQTKPDAKAQTMEKGARLDAQPDERSKDQNGKLATAHIEQAPSEQALAVEQWLRQIPDDPSGLLRRKFLIEHLKREQESRQ